MPSCELFFTTVSAARGGWALSSVSRRRADIGGTPCEPGRLVFASSAYSSKARISSCKDRNCRSSSSIDRMASSLYSP